jgi:hypothetical protein
VVRAAVRAKSLQPDGLPFGVVSMDGKVTMLPVVDDQLTQRQTGNDKSKPKGALRTVTCALVSSRAKVIVHVTPIPAHTNEAGVFATAFDELRTAFPRLFRLVAYDAGACSEANGRHVVDAGYHYLFVLTDGQPTLLAEAQSELAIASCVASTEDVRSNEHTVVRRLYLTEDLAGLHWAHLRTVGCVETLTTRHGVTRADRRYYASSLPSGELTPQQWLAVIRRRWAVENEAHHTLDTVFAEDDHPWIEGSPQGALNVLVLRRIALTILALYRSVHLRANGRRDCPWRQLLGWLLMSLLQLTEKEADAALAPNARSAASRAPPLAA